MKDVRQKRILEIIQSHPVATQQELVKRLASRGIEATQSSVSRDIVTLGLTKFNGRYVAPRAPEIFAMPPIELDTAGDNFIVVKTSSGQAQTVAVRIDGARIQEVVGTVAGDDTIFIAVKDRANQRAAMTAIAKLFGLSNGRVNRATR